MTAPPEIDDTTYKWRAFAAIAVYFITAVLSFTMVFLALPAIADDFDVTLRAASWVVIIHALTISALLLPLGRLADLIGRRRIHLLGLVVFAAGALGSAAAPSLWALIGARVVMAVGDAMSQSVSTGILVSVFPPSERGKAIGGQTTAVAAGAAAAPIFTGLILQVLPWRGLFALLVLPLGFAFVAGRRFLDEERLTPDAAADEPTPPFDRIGALLSGTAMILLILVVNNPLELAWRSVAVGVAAVVVVGLIVAFVRWELRVPHPMLQLGFFRGRLFALSVSARLVGFMGAAAIYILVPIFIVSFRGLSETTAGLMLFLNSIGLGVTAQTAGRLSDRFGTRPFMITGFTLMALTSLVFATFDATTALWVVAVTSLLNGVATGAWNPPNNATILGSVSSADYGVIGAFTNLTRNIGSVIGQAGMAAVVTLVMVNQGFDVPLGEIADTAGSGGAFVDGWKVAYWMATGASLVALILTITAPRPQRTP